MSPSRAHRRLAAAAAAVFLTMGAVGLGGALRWLDQPFPGFLVLANGVVASATVPGWPATADGSIYQHRVETVNGQPLANATDLQTAVRSQPVGTIIHYRFARGGKSFERAIATRSFGARDFLLLYGLYLLNGIALAIAALVVCLRGADRVAARSALPFLGLAALWGLSALDLYGPYRLFRLHVWCEALLFAAALHMAIGFPRPLLRRTHRLAVLAAAWPLAVGLGIVYQQSLPDANAYVRWHLLATSAGGTALLVLVISQLVRALHLRWRGVPDPAPSVVVGTVMALLLPVALTVAEPFTGGSSPQSMVALTVFLFPMSVSYSAYREQLFRP